MLPPWVVIGFLKHNTVPLDVDGSFKDNTFVTTLLLHLSKSILSNAHVDLPRARQESERERRALRKVGTADRAAELATERRAGDLDGIEKGIAKASSSSTAGGSEALAPHSASALTPPLGKAADLDAGPGLADLIHCLCCGEWSQPKFASAFFLTDLGYQPRWLGIKAVASPFIPLLAELGQQIPHN